MERGEYLAWCIYWWPTKMRPCLKPGGKWRPHQRLLSDPYTCAMHVSAHIHIYKHEHAHTIFKNASLDELFLFLMHLQITGKKSNFHQYWKIYGLLNILLSHSIDLECHTSVFAQWKQTHVWQLFTEDWIYWWELQLCRQEKENCILNSLVYVNLSPWGGELPDGAQIEADMLMIHCLEIN